jgi:hypothetical protein
MQVECRLHSALGGGRGGSFRAVGLAFCFFKRGTADSGALKANALPGGARRLAVRAVKGARFAFIGAKRETLEVKLWGDNAPFVALPKNLQ